MPDPGGAGVRISKSVSAGVSVSRHESRGVQGEFMVSVSVSVSEN